MTTEIQVSIDKTGQITTEYLCDSELKRFLWDSNEKVIEMVFLSMRNIIYKLRFDTVYEFRIDGFEKYNISTTFFLASNLGFNISTSTQYLKDLFRESEAYEATSQARVRQQIQESLNLCMKGDAVLFANDAAVGCVVTILCKTMTGEIL